jgi:DNA replication protein DnaC
MPLNPLDLSNIPEIDFPGLPSTGKALDDFREMADCPTHGQYLVRDSVYSHNPGGCPDCLRIARAESLLSTCNIPARFAACEFDNYEVENDKQRRVLDACQAYASEFKGHLAAGRGLIMLGNPGTGKNHLVTAIGKALRAQRFTVLRVKATEFLDAYWSKEFGERDEWLKGLSRVQLLVLDEVGRSSKTDNAQNAFFRLIDARYEAVHPTIVLSNLDRQGVIEVLGEAAYDRLTEAGAQRLTFDWQSRRAQTGRGAA